MLVVQSFSEQRSLTMRKTSSARPKAMRALQRGTMTSS